MVLELLFNALLAVFFIFVLITSMQIPHQSSASDIVEATGFPVGLSVICLVLLVVIVYDTIKKGQPTKTEAGGMSRKAQIRVGILVGMTIFYILSINTLGFMISTLLTLFVYVNAMGSKRHMFNVIFSISFMMTLTVIFGRVFMVPLPRGIDLLRELSFYIY